MDLKQLLANRGDVQESDRRLNEYLRQENIPSELESKYPNISRLVGAKNIGQSDMDVMSALGKSVEPDSYAGVSAKSGYMPAAFQRNAEMAASNAYAKDVAGTEDVSKLIQFLQNRDNINYDTYSNKAISDALKKHNRFGEFHNNENVMLLDTDLPTPRIIDTIIHEHGHARDTVKSLPKSELINQVKAGEEKFNIPIPLAHAALLGRDPMAAASAITAKHFTEPGSHSLNEFLKATKEIGKKEGVEPGYKSKYEDIRKLLEE